MGAIIISKCYTLNLKGSLQQRNSDIDVLRGLSILTVILLHLNIHFEISDTFLKEILPKKLFSLLFWSGFYGVVVFFTLSGYLITNSIIKRWGTLSKVDLRTFYWYRFSRIVPLLSVLLIVLSILHLGSVCSFVIDPEQTSLGRVILSALTFHTNWLEIQVGYPPANWDILWSISIEETFYLFFLSPVCS
jgi:peptidoglycan/LPS O-acetylase OafA/YrhL